MCIVQKNEENSFLKIQFIVFTDMKNTGGMKCRKSGCLWEVWKREVQSSRKVDEGKKRDSSEQKKPRRNEKYQSIDNMKIRTNGISLTNEQ